MDETSRRRPGIPLFLSLLLPGAGQIHDGRVARGCLILGVTLASALLFRSVDLHEVWLAPLWLWQVWDAS